MGTPDFACPCLTALLDAGHEVSLVLCQPDKKKGRGHQLQAPPVKQLAMEHQIEVFQPRSLKEPETLARLAAEDADFFAVVAYGKILPLGLLNLPKMGCINVHGSLLPALRGAAPIQYSLLLGHPKTGVCTMMMDEGLDTGDMLLTEETDILPSENTGELALRLSALGANLLVKTIEDFDGIAKRPQDSASATYSHMIKKSDRLLDWSQSAVDLHNRFRALSPLPGVTSLFRGKGIKICECSLGHGAGAPGEVLEMNKQGILVAAGQGALWLSSLQPESKKAMAASDLANGYQIKTGELFGQ